MDDQASITELKGIGEKKQKLFEKINVQTIRDLIQYYPKGYDQYEEPITISQASKGEVCAVLCTIKEVQNLKRIRNLTILNLVVQDHSSTMQITFFNMSFLIKTLKKGEIYIFRGLIQSRGNNKVMEQPKFFTPDAYEKQIHILQPRYGLTKGLNNQTIQKAVKQALDVCPKQEERYSKELIRDYQLITISEAIYAIHFPKDFQAMYHARKRIAFDEFFDFMFLLRKNKEIGTALENHYNMFETADTVRFLEQLPFSLTNGQKKVWQEIRDDFAGKTCMNRLIQGDVGSGKTIIAVLALLMCAANGYQGALMAPTEVLAVQHFESISGYIKEYHLAFRPVLLVGSMSAKEKKEAYARIA